MASPQDGSESGTPEFSQGDDHSAPFSSSQCPSEHSARDSRGEPGREKEHLTGPWGWRAEGRARLPPHRRPEFLESQSTQHIVTGPGCVPLVQAPDVALCEMDQVLPHRASIRAGER